nr:ribonuclease H-like domain-containing protein [Tanacetum cinerariifolium]
MTIEHYLCHKNYPIWQVIQNVNGHVSVITDTNGMIKVLPPKTTEEVVARERERKARTTLLMALPEDHLAKLHKMADAKETWEAIKSRFEGLHKGPLPSSWSQVALIMRTKPGLDTLSFDDLYNNLRVFEHDVKGTIASSSSNSQNVAFVSADNISSTNDVAMISIRIKKFHKRTGKELQFDTKDTVGFDKTKVECFNCHKMRHFARDCRAKWNQNNRRRDGGYNGNKARDNSRRHAYQDDSKALVTMDGEEIDYDSDSSVEPSTTVLELVVNESKVVSEPKVVNDPKVWTDAPIIEEYESDSDDDSIENVKETGTPNHYSKIEMQDRHSHTRKGLGYARKSCFVCARFSHLIRDCDFHEKRMAKQDAFTKSKEMAQRHTFANHKVNTVNTSLSAVKGNGDTTVKASAGCNWRNKRYSLNKVYNYNNGSKFRKSVKDPLGRLKSEMAWVPKRIRFLLFHVPDDPHKALKDKEIIDSGCSRHMTGNKAHLAYYQEFKGGSVAFEGSNGRITSKGKIKAGKLDFEDVYYMEELKHYNLFFVSQMCNKKNKVLFTDTDRLVLSPNFNFPDENQVLLKIPRQHNMYSFNLKNIDPSGDLSYLFAKASIDESNKWHRRLGHVNFKNLNKLVKGNLVRGPKEANHSEGTEANDDQDANLEEIDLHDKHFILPEKLEKLKRQYKEANDAARKEATHEIQDGHTNSTNLLNVVSTPISAVGPSRDLNDDEPSYLNDPSMPHLEDIYASPSAGIFTNSSYDDEGMVTDFNNLDTTMNVNLTPTTRIHTIYPKTQILRDPLLAVQTRSKVHKNFEAHALVWVLVNFPFGKKAIGTKWVYRNKKDKRGVVVRNKARLVAQGHRQEEGINYNKVFAPVERIKAIRIFLAFASYMGFIVYQMHVKSAFLYETIDEEVYVTQPPRFVDPKFPNKVYKVVKALYGLHQAPRACVKTASTLIETQKPLVKDEGAADVDVYLYRSIIDSLMFLTASMPDIMFVVCACSRFQVTPKTSHLQVTIVATATIEAEYVAAAHCYGQVLWIQNQLLDYGFNLINTKIYIDNESTICIVKNPVFHSKTKHIEIRHHFIRDAYEKKLIKVLKIHTDDNVVDLLMKDFDVSSKELASPKQMALGKDESNLLIVDSLLKNIWSSMHHVIAMKHWLFQSKWLLFWSTSKVKTVNDEVRVQALIDGKRININEYSILRTLQLDDEQEGWYKFFGVITPLFENMLVPAAEELGQAQDDVPSLAPLPQHTIPSPTNDPIPDADKDSLKFQELMDLCTRLSNKVLDLESEVIDLKSSFTHKIAKLEDRVHKLEEENKILKATSFKSAKVDTATPVEDKEESFKQRRVIADMDKDVEDTNKEEPAKVEEVLEVVKVAKLMTEVVITAQPTTTTAQVPKLSAPRRRRGVIIQDPEETTTSVIMHTEVLPKDKRKGILIEESKPLKRQAQIDMDEAFNNEVMRFQDLKRKHVTKAHARKNMMIYLKNMVGFKMDLFKGMTYSDIRPIFKKLYNSIQAFLEKEEEVTIQEKRQGESLEQETAKKQRIDEDVEELKRHLLIVTNDDDYVYTKATPLASKVPIVNYQIHHENNKPYYKIIKVDGTHKLFLSFITLLKNFEKEDLEALWKLVKERFETTEPKNFLDDFLLNTLKIMFEKPNVKANVWRDQKGRYGLAKGQKLEVV